MLHTICNNISYKLKSLEVLIEDQMDKFKVVLELFSTLNLEKLFRLLRLFELFRLKKDILSENPYPSLYI